ncbi:MAG: hypothetical protein UH850_08100 [Paludibacteraceae bacterium]|nr:hypothetical protein [Paludibacteraceae bacterium]
MKQKFLLFVVYLYPLFCFFLYFAFIAFMVKCAYDDIFGHHKKFELYCKTNDYLMYGDSLTILYSKEEREGYKYRYYCEFSIIKTEGFFSNENDSKPFVGIMDTSSSKAIIEVLYFSRKNSGTPVPDRFPKNMDSVLIDSKNEKIFFYNEQDSCVVDMLVNDDDSDIYEEYETENTIRF